MWPYWLLKTGAALFVIDYLSLNINIYHKLHCSWASLRGRIGSFGAKCQQSWLNLADWLVAMMSPMSEADSWNSGRQRGFTQTYIYNLNIFLLFYCSTGARKAADAALRGHAVALTIRPLRPLRTDGAAVTRRIRLEAPVILPWGNLLERE